jgi:hypothetical protein
LNLIELYRMMADVIQFVTKGGLLNLKTFLILKKSVNETIKEKGWVCFSDFIRFRSQIMINQVPNGPDTILAHLNIMIKACLYPVLSNDYNLQLYLKDCGLNDRDFIFAILSCIESQIPPGIPNIAFDAFRRDAYTFMAKSSTIPDYSEKNLNPSDYQPTSKMNPVTPVFEPKAQKFQHPPQQFGHSIPYERSQNIPSIHDQVSMATKLSRQLSNDRDKVAYFDKISRNDSSHTVKGHLMQQQTLSHALPTKGDSNHSAMRSISFDMNHLSSLMRKNGMDFITPSNLHDKVLACIYLGSFILLPGESSTTPPLRTHKELVDVTIEVQDRGHLGSSNNAPLSKTKLRGVLGLLKSAGILNVQHLDEFDEPTSVEASAIKEVKLSLERSIHTFEDFRIMHDHFIPEWVKSTGNWKLSSAEKRILLWNPDELQSNLTRISCFLGIARPIIKSKLYRTITSMENKTAAQKSTPNTDDWDDLAKQITQQAFQPRVDTALELFSRKDDDGANLSLFSQEHSIMSTVDLPNISNQLNPFTQTIADMFQFEEMKTDPELMSHDNYAQSIQDEVEALMQQKSPSSSQRI